MGAPESRRRSEMGRGEPEAAARADRTGRSRRRSDASTPSPDAARRGPPCDIPPRRQWQAHGQRQVRLRGRLCRGAGGPPGRDRRPAASDDARLGKPATDHGCHARGHPVGRTRPRRRPAAASRHRAGGCACGLRGDDPPRRGPGACRPADARALHAGRAAEPDQAGCDGRHGGAQGRGRPHRRWETRP